MINLVQALIDGNCYFTFKLYELGEDTFFMINYEVQILEIVIIAAIYRVNKINSDRILQYLFIWRNIKTECYNG